MWIYKLSYARQQIVTLKGTIVYLRDPQSKKLVRLYYFLKKKDHTKLKEKQL